MNSHWNQHPWTLWYRLPAGRWEEALPLGGGRLGAMVHGDARNELIQLNEDTLWSGFPRDHINYDAQRYLKQARELIADGKYAEAQALIEAKMQGSNVEAYQPLGDLSIRHADEPEPAVGDYIRGLDIARAIARTEYRLGDAMIRREYWISHPDDAMAVRYAADRACLNMVIELSSVHPHTIAKAGEGGIALLGQSPSHVESNYFRDHPLAVMYEDGLGMRYVIRLQAESRDGQVTVRDGKIHIAGASEFTLYWTAATNFAGYDRHPAPHDPRPRERCEQIIGNLRQYRYEELLERHIADHESLFARVDLELERTAHSVLPTDERLAAYKQHGNDPQLEALYFQYGRYLLIACSRPGTQAAHLQGIWNPHVEPPWFCDYTTNINTEMNYWPAEVTGLGELHEPLFDLIEELAETGRRAARIHYGCRGWTAHHNVDIWRKPTPSDGDACWAFWPMAGAWLVRHLWEHYLYNRDEAFLRERAYPLMKGCALFCLDWLVEGPDGVLVTSPSTTPENKFLDEDGRPCSVSMATTMDISLIRELFTHMLEASAIVGEAEDAQLLDDMRAALEKLPAPKIGRYGQLQEWFEDFPEAEPGHRHVSHLYGLYPACEFTEATPELLEACRTTLRMRLDNGGGHTGWSCAWMINLFARLKDAEQAHEYVRALLSRSTYPNLFDAHPPFQIDGNFGGTAGIAEMLLQSHGGAIELLPALPAAWRNGSVRGLRARGGFIVDIAWQDGKLTNARMTANVGGTCRLRYGDAIKEFEAEAGKSYEWHHI